MSPSCKTRLMAMSAIALFASLGAIQAADDDLIPRQFPKDQREKLQRFVGWRNQRHDGVVKMRDERQMKAALNSPA